ncbi:MAG: NfeD family protein [Planctomycetota bacterium]|jgi:membrane-bound serine protease (ClpP class)
MRIINLLLTALMAAIALPAVAAEEPAKPAKAKYLVAVINLEGTVEGVMERTVERRINLALEDGADVLLFEVTTDGGLLSSGLEIAQLIDRQEAHTVMFVKEKAYSAGTLISLAADEIYIQGKGMIGSAAVVSGSIPLLPNPRHKNEPSTAEMKALAVYYRVLKDLCERNGYNYYIVQGMVMPFEREFIIFKYRDVDGKWKETILNWEQTGEFKEEIGMRSENDFKEGDVFMPPGLLALNGNDAEKYGFGSKIAENRSEVIESLKKRFIEENETTVGPVLEVREYGETWWERFVWFMAQPVPRGIILLLGLLGIFIEYKTPGFGFPGAIGAACIFLFFFVAYLADLATLIEPIIFTLGAILVALELFVIPGFGVAGVSGIILMGIAIILAMQRFTIPASSGDWDITMKNAGTVVLVMIGFLISAWTIAKYFPKARSIAGHIIAFGPEAAEVHGGAAKDGEHAALLGLRGRAETALRPAGRAVIDGRRYDVVTRGGFIDADADIIVSEVSGNRIVVKPADSKPVSGDT